MLTPRKDGGSPLLAVALGKMPVHESKLKESKGQKEHTPFIPEQVPVLSPNMPIEETETVIANRALLKIGANPEEQDPLFNVHLRYWLAHLAGYKNSKKAYLHTQPSYNLLSWFSDVYIDGDGAVIFILPIIKNKRLEALIQVMQDASNRPTWRDAAIKLANMSGFIGTDYHGCLSLLKSTYNLVGLPREMPGIKVEGNSFGLKLHIPLTLFIDQGYNITLRKRIGEAHQPTFQLKSGGQLSQRLEWLFLANFLVPPNNMEFKDCKTDVITIDGEHKEKYVSSQRREEDKTLAAAKLLRSFNF